MTQDDPLVQVALDLSQSLPTDARYSRLLQAVRNLVPCAVAVLFRLDHGVLVPLAVDGLPEALMANRFIPGEHPRLSAILGSRRPVRFAADDPLPDPFDAWLRDPEEKGARVHACMGCGLWLENRVVGLLTMDALEEGAFDNVSNMQLERIAALAAATMQTAALIDALEEKVEKNQRVAVELQRDTFHREGSLLIGESAPIQTLKREISMVAASDLPVLILGETGTGKELVARLLHMGSPRAEQAMVHVNCAALPESIAESELFGHIKGAFTGASQDRMGKFELADDGTLFLDEVGELPLSIQATMLRALQSGEIQRVGSDRMHRVNARVIAATNRDLSREVKQGRFRADLYHRLSVYPLQIPPLRDRKDDIARLSDYFLGQISLKLGVRSLRLDKEALQVLEHYDWPGNVRELEHSLTRASLRASRASDKPGSVVKAEHLDGIFMQGAAGLLLSKQQNKQDKFEPLAQSVLNFQKREIERALRACDGNWAAAARLLGMHRSNLHRLAQRLGIK
ncbi:nitric oxide reductase transcriptional regulator NorR [Oligoflexus tunisiensis]|uniref:nitric oxide reductase transcriptional regulator NorR n=1 Tax=Oligoflexus tunisiensis TaxID=708132 RepID=UPI000AE30788|nr:nitric oxide reductase transcriptional regulator NorR [Oligoflexus tunisiensis]